MPRRKPSPSAPQFDDAAIIKFLGEDISRPSRSRELARMMGVPEREYRDFRARLKRLIAEGRLVRLKRGRLAPPDPLNLVVGKVVVRRGGNVFVRPEGQGDLTGDIFIRPRERMTALAGDRVMVRRHAQREGPSVEGEIIRIVERGNTPILGIFRQAKYFSYVVPDPPHPLREIYVVPSSAKSVKVGQQVIIQITDWEYPDQTPTGKILRILGFPDEPGVDMERVIASFQLPQKFPKEVLDEAKSYPEEITDPDLAGRRDFRGLVTFTIDPADAKDHDDAVSLERVGEIWRLGVHIADVTHYVREGSALDEEALERGTSVYLVDRVIPMLPERLSNELCSLKPKVDRLSVSCLIDLTDAGEMKRYEFCRSVIRSRAKISYDEVSAYFYNGVESKTVKPYLTLLDQMRTLSQTLRKNRFQNGALDIEAPEAKVHLDESGRPVEIVLRHSDHSHQLVEEFMLIANQCAAHMYLKRNRPCLYRVHAPPSQEKMEEFAGFVESLGYRFAVKGGVKPRQLARLLDKVREDPRKDMIHMVLLRSLMKAVYQPENVGHFGLAFAHYAHFTSPIRRYPDLWIHRHLIKMIDGAWSTEAQHRARAALSAIGKKTSERERLAEDAERESVRIKQIEYLESHIGEEFEGQISGFLEFGFFVSLKGVGADGLVRFSSIDDDYYTWEKERWHVKGRRSGRLFSLGDSVTVRLVKTDAERREVDLVLKESEKRPKGSGLPRGRRRR
ncbi:MAG: ribonuclease R [Candidatus Zixiibacteriota bacterium]